MNKTIAGVIVLVVLGAAVYFLIGNKPDDATQQETGETQDTTQGQNQEVGENEAVPSTMRDLLAGGSQKCTYTQTIAENNTTANGTTYVSDGRMRMDISSTTNGVAMTSHAIMLDNTYYSWMDGEGQYAVKMQIDPSAAAGTVPEGSDGPASQTVDWDQRFDFDCDPWTADQAMFTLPAGVEFLDLASLSEGLDGM